MSECLCGAVIEADTVERLQELLSEHGMDAPTEPLTRPSVD